MKTVTIHVTRLNPPSLHANTIHLTTCKVGKGDVVYNVLSDGTNILTDNLGQYLIAGAIKVMASGGKMLTDNYNNLLNP